MLRRKFVYFLLLFLLLPQDTDGDGVPDFMDEDDDGDGIPGNYYCSF